MPYHVLESSALILKNEEAINVKRRKKIEGVPDKRAREWEWERKKIYTEIEREINDNKKCKKR